MDWLTGLGVGAAAAAVRVVLGLLKAQEAFEWGKALRTLCIGVIGGALTGGLWQAANIRELFAAVFFETVALDEIMGTIAKNQ